VIFPAHVARSSTVEPAFAEPGDTVIDAAKALACLFGRRAAGGNPIAL
jgi:hypothetical protein